MNDILNDTKALKTTITAALAQSRAVREIDVFALLNPEMAANPIMKGKREPRVPAAVLIPIIDRADEPMVVLNRRTKNMPTHARQIAFPGGKVQANDENRIATALREAEEENGIIADNVDVLGRLGDHLGGYNFAVSPIVGIIDPQTDYIRCEREVDEIFEVPLSFVLNMDNHIIQQKEDRGVTFNMPAMPYKEYQTWGLTAAMLRSFAEVIAVQNNTPHLAIDDIYQATLKEG